MGAQAAIKDVLEQLKQSTLQLTHSLKVCCACQAEHMHTSYLLTNTPVLPSCSFVRHMQGGQLPMLVRCVVSIL